jgi:hypothetical protein
MANEIEVNDVWFRRAFLKCGQRTTKFPSAILDHLSNRAKSIHMRICCKAHWYACTCTFKSFLILARHHLEVCQGWCFPGEHWQFKYCFSAQVANGKGLPGSTRTEESLFHACAKLEEGRQKWNVVRILVESIRIAHAFSLLSLSWNKTTERYLRIEREDQRRPSPIVRRASRQQQSCVCAIVTFWALSYRTHL